MSPNYDLRYIAPIARGLMGPGLFAEWLFMAREFHGTPYCACCGLTFEALFDLADIVGLSTGPIKDPICCDGEET